MCGRYSLHSLPEVIALQFGLASAPAIMPRYNVAPGTELLAVRVDAGGRRVAQMLRWGLIPSWAKDPAIGNRMINARAETLAEKPSFRTALKRRRCIIPADGFYEWKNTGGRKQPYFVRPSADQLWGLAGLYELWQGPQGALHSCTIVTTAANEFMRQLHERMPVILPRDAYAYWLDSANSDSAALGNLLLALPAEAMRAYPVSQRVNSVRNYDPSLIEESVPAA